MSDKAYLRPVKMTLPCNATMSATIDNGQGNGISLFVLEIYLTPDSINGLIFATEKAEPRRWTLRDSKKDTHIKMGCQRATEKDT